MMNTTDQTTIPEVGEEEDDEFYGLWIHDDETYHMEEFWDDSNGDPVEALHLYAEFMRSRAQYLDKLAEAIDKELSEDVWICIDIDPEGIGLCGDKEALDRIADMKLIERY